MKINILSFKTSFFILSFILCSLLKAQINPQLKILQNKFNSLDNISADFVESSNGKENLSGKFYYQKENKLRLELKNITIVSNGTDTWNYNKKEKKLIISSFDNNDPSLLSIKNIVDIYPSKCKVENETAGSLNILIFTPKGNGLPFSSVKLWLNNQNLISKMIIIDNGGRTIQVDFSNYKLDEKLPSSLFKINPPKGSKIIDLR
jgi:outer membrane lipoprotein-sorting protein